VNNVQELYRPVFLDVMVDPDAGVYSMAGSGKRYKEIITGYHVNNHYDSSGD